MENFDITITELEFKYLANDIKMKEFNKFATELNPEQRVEVSSWDIYYKSTGLALPFEFMRYRQGPKPELTIKIKANEKNNNARTEIDIPLNPGIPDQEVEHIVSSFCEQFGFKEEFRIFKFCSIFFYEKTDMVYYVTFNEEMKELDRFIEVEARKDRKFDSAEQAWALVHELEQKLSVFGITPKNRMKKSQWELNKR